MKVKKSDINKKISIDNAQIIWRNLLHLNTDSPEVFLKQLKDMYHSCSGDQVIVEGYTNRSVQYVLEKMIRSYKNTLVNVIAFAPEQVSLLKSQPLNARIKSLADLIMNNDKLTIYKPNYRVLEKKILVTKNLKKTKARNAKKLEIIP